MAPLLVAGEPEVERKRQPMAKFLYQDIQQNVESAEYARRNFERANDTSMIQSRRRMQQERKDTLDLQTMSRESFLASIHFRQDDITQTPEKEIEEPEAPTIIDWSPPPELLGPKERPYTTGDQRRPVFAKVERCHREMVRREVWRQKFDFIYRQVIEKELREGGPSESHRRPSTCSNSGAGGGANSSVHGGAEPSELHGPGARAELQGRPATTSAVGSLPSRLSSPSKAKRGQGRSASHTTSSTRDLPGASAQQRQAQAATGFGAVEEADDAPLAAPARAGWRRTGFRSSTGLSRPQTGSRPSSQMKGHTQRGGEPGGGITPIPVTTVNSVGSTPSHSKANPTIVQHMLQASCSLPLLPTELHCVRDDYYGGDETFLHEDILYSSNPRLFPLRMGGGKAFPTSSLKTIATC